MEAFLLIMLFLIPVFVLSVIGLAFLYGLYSGAAAK